MYIVEFPNSWFLRGTVATGTIDRATKFETETDAHVALDKAKKFLGSRGTKNARIVRLEQEAPC
jgi:hypothetical protein